VFERPASRLKPFVRHINTRSKRMKIRNVLYAAALVIATAGITTTVVSQENKNKAPGQQPPMTPEMQEMMQKCEAAGTPGENHKLLGTRVGKWNGSGKMWWTPDAPPSETTCTADVKSLYEGRYFTETVEGTMPEGGTFLGQSWVGYDNVGEKFFWMWIDNMSTGKMDAEGTYDAATKTFTYATEMNCPMNGKLVKGRTIEKWTDNDHFTMSMYGPWFQTGKEYKMMEITYTRAR
jgi:hypothetical protein